MSAGPEPLLFDLSARAKLHLRGADVLRFLNGQVSNDVRKATPSHAIEACVLNAKGKVDAHVFIRATDDGFLIDAERELREALAARFERYIIADDVAIEDVTERYALFHLVGGSPGEGEETSALRFDRVGRDLWRPASAAEATLRELSGNFILMTDEQAETHRIEHGIPRWGRELTAEIIPTEAGLEERAIDFAKGCYIGQEVISRMKMSGQTNKRLCGLIAADQAALSVPGRLRDAEGKEVGWITSSVWSVRVNASIGLGFVKRGFNSPGTRLVAGEGGAPNIEVVALPFA